MDSWILQVLLICGLLYGLIKFVVEVMRTAKVNKTQIGLSIALIVSCGAALLMTIGG